MPMMLANDRLSRLEELLKQQGSLQVSQLSAELGVSEMTVRRDLNMLARNGRVNRVHGGATASHPWGFGARLQSQSRVKQSLMRKAADSLPKVGCVYMDGSTTVFGLCEFFEGIRDLQVVTNNLQTFQRLIGIPGVKPMLLGGSLDPRTDSLVGPLARRSLQSLHFDCAFMSCYALHEELGFMEATLEDAEVKDMAAKRSSEILLAVDDRKFGLTAAGSWYGAPAKSVLVTNVKKQDRKLKPFLDSFREIL